MPTREQPLRAQIAASPALMAQAISRGRWRMFPHHELVDRWVTRLVRRAIPERILLIEEPPRHGKSQHVSHWLPAWHVWNWPDRTVGLASYEARFARSWGRQARQSFLEAAPLRDLRVDLRRDAADEWGPLGHPGGMITAGVGGPLTGRGFHLLVVDDPIKNAEQAQSESYREAVWDWWQSTAFTRLEPDGVAVVMQTRWHPDDLIGRMLKRARDEGGAAVRRIRLPALSEGPGDLLGRPEGTALWPQRWSEARLREVERSMGRYWWLALYQQRPSQHDRAEWPEQYFADAWVDQGPPPSETLLRVMALDPSLGETARSDYSAFVMVTLARDGTAYVEADLDRRDVVRIVDDGVALFRQFQPAAWAVEKNGFGALLPLIRERHPRLALPLASVTQHRNKAVRIRLGVGPWLGAGKLRFVRGRAGTAQLVQQLQDFPLADHDDGPDALEMALLLAQRVAEQGPPAPDTETRLIA